MFTYLNSKDTIDPDVNLTTTNKIVYVFITGETTTSKPNININDCLLQSGQYQLFRQPPYSLIDSQTRYARYVHPFELGGDYRSRREFDNK